MLVLLLALRLRADTTTVSSGSADEFAAALSNVVASGGGTILVTAPVVIDPTNGTEVFDGVSNVFVSGGNTNALFTVNNGGNLTLADMVLENGLATNDGGAIFIALGGFASFTNCLFSNNIALGATGLSPIQTTNVFTNSTGKLETNVVSSGKTTAAAPAFGGAVFNLGTLSVLNCQFVTNSAIGGTGGDGADGGDGTIRGGNGSRGSRGGAAFGGGIYTAGALFVMNSTFANNLAQGGGGGSGGAGGSGLIAGVSGNGAAGGGAAGGGLYTTNTNAVIVILASTFANNLALGGASATGGTSQAGTGQGGPAGGSALGGGIDNDNGSSMTLTNCTFSGNTAGGGTGGNGGPGGGRGGGGGNGGNAIGGGIYNLGTVSVVSCTLSVNAAIGGTNGVAGSGISSSGDGRRGASRGGDIANQARKKKGSFFLMDSIIAASLSGGGGFGTIIDGGYNISADRSIVFKPAKKGGTSLSRTNPLVGDLADNGGPTETIAIASNSPAVNFIPPEDAPPVDQRGVSRPQLAKSDAGAFELNPNELIILTQPQSTNVLIGSNVTFSITVQGPGPQFYQWYFDPSNVTAGPADLLTNQTDSTLTLTNIQLTNAGQYQVVVTNASSAVTSHVAVLTVSTATNSAPVITAITPMQTVLVGTNVTISVTATSTPPPVYQWFFQGSDFIATALTNGGNISGATSNILSIVNVQTTNAGNYIVLVTNILGAATNSSTLIVQTNSGGGGIIPPSPLSLRGSSKALERPSSLPRVSNRARGAPMPSARSQAEVRFGTWTGRSRPDEFHQPQINPAGARDCEAFDDAPPWAFWRDARPPGKTSPYCRRSIPAIA